jgi:hypothetical protein
MRILVPARAALPPAAFALAIACAAQRTESGTRDSTTTTATATTTTANTTTNTATNTTATSDTNWKSLIEQNAAPAWRGYKMDSFPRGWTVSDGVLSKNGSVEDLLTRDQFGDFELDWDWKLAPGGNAGVFYRATEEYNKVYWSGPEYQLLDDAKHPDGKSRLTSAGAAYGLYPSPAGIVKPANEWNSSRIVARGAHVEHWLNGQKVVDYELESPDWAAKVKASKFSAYPNYGRATRGHIGLQGDHDGTLRIRNMRIRELR